MIQDTPELRVLLALFFPSLTISSAVKQSGQRVVYFCHFGPDPKHDIRKEWYRWGPVVLKVSSGIDPLSIAYMQKEIEILRGIDNKHYPKLLYHTIFSEHPDTEERLQERLFVTIEERIDAEPLTACKKRFQSERKIVELLLNLLTALEPLWTHKQRLVHRDLKPDNILIKRNGDVVVIDLGILRETGVIGLTNVLAPFGPLSAPYASPEQANNKKEEISFRSDFFALGTVSYELTAGCNPFVPRQDCSFQEILDNVRKFVPQDLQSKCGASEGFSNLVKRLMEKSLSSGIEQ